MIRAAKVFALLTACYIAALCAVIGPPRLIGYGCTNGALGYTGPRLAREESDFIGTCRDVRPIASLLTE